MNRLIKRLFLDFELFDRRKNKKSTSLIVYENGIGSDYLNWLEKVIPEEVDIIQLKWGSNLRIRNKDIERAFLLSYKNIFFHSPGEVLQAKLLQYLKASSFVGHTIGLQHGFIGSNPPLGLNKVLKFNQADSYISFESKFTNQLKINTNAIVIENIFSNIIFKPAISLPSFFDVYFDAPDKGSFYTNVTDLVDLISNNSYKLISLNFHPSTSKIFRLITYFKLRRFLTNLSQFTSKSAICWDSKVKYDLLAKGGRVFSIDSLGILRELTLLKEEFSFNKHVNETLRELLLA